MCYVCAYVCVYVQVPMDARIFYPLELGLQATVSRWLWVLGETEPWSSGRTAVVLNY